MRREGPAPATRLHQTAGAGDAELAELVAAWPALPAEARAAVLAVVRKAASRPQ